MAAAARRMYKIIEGGIRRADGIVSERVQILAGAVERAGGARIMTAHRVVDQDREKICIGGGLREGDYRRFTLNQRITVATPFVSPSLWESCHGRVAPLAELP